jgi:hypothetical protein
MWMRRWLQLICREFAQKTVQGVRVPLTDLGLKLRI